MLKWKKLVKILKRKTGNKEIPKCSNCISGKFGLYWSNHYKAMVYADPTGTCIDSRNISSWGIPKYNCYGQRYDGKFLAWYHKQCGQEGKWFKPIKVQLKVINGGK